VEVVHERPWSTVLRVPLSGGVNCFFKACAWIQAFEPRLTADLASRWPDLVPEVIAYDQVRAWLLLGDAGTQIRALGNPPRLWLELLPRYAELQRNETEHASEHLAHGVPDLRLATLPTRYGDLLTLDLPVETNERRYLLEFERRFVELCAELAAYRISDTIQHDDLHAWNIYAKSSRLRVLDWGDSSISHPFASLLVTFRFLEQINGLQVTNPWFARLRDAYLEPWGTGLQRVFELAMRVGAVAHAIASVRQRRAIPEEGHPEFDVDFRTVLRRALALNVLQAADGT
jgi:hypothetical protein